MIFPVCSRRCVFVLIGVVLAACGGSGRSIGGTVRGLVGKTLVLQNGTDRLVLSGVAEVESFLFPSRVSPGSPYEVTVAQQPSDPAQVCTVANGKGEVGSENVSSILVTCLSAAAHSVSGTIEGLVGSGLVLRNNGGDELSLVPPATTFRFSGLVAEGSPFAVTVAQQPSNPSQTCEVAGGSATMGAADVDGVRITCSTDSFAIGGTISGLKGSGLVIENGGELIEVPPNATTFEFAKRYPEGSAYAVTILPRPIHDPMQRCVVHSGNGTMGRGPMNGIQIECKLLLASHLYVTASDAREVWGFPVQADGTLNAAAVVKTSDGMQSPYSMTVDPAGKYAFVTSGKDGYTTGAISTYSIDAATGALTWVGKSLETGRYPYSVTLDPSGHLVYVANGMDHVVSAYTVDSQSGQLEVVPNSPFDVGQYPISVTVDPTGRFVYTANHGDAGYASGVSFSKIVAGTSPGTVNGALILLGSLLDTPLDAKGYAAEVAVVAEPTGRFVYLVNYNGNVKGYSITGTGALEPLSSAATTAGRGPISAAITPSGRFLYVANQQSKDISAFSIDTTTGALSSVAGSPFVPGANGTQDCPVHITVDPSSRFAYLADLTGKVLLYSIDPLTGALTYSTSYTVGSGAMSLVVTNVLGDVIP